MDKHRKKLFVIDAFILLLTVFLLFSGYKTYDVFKEFHDAEQEYEEIQQIVISDSNMTENEESKKMVDFEKLREINPEVVGWIRFEEPSVIDYPIVQGEDNEKYLTTTFEGEENGAGCIYMDTDNAGDFSDKNTFIYGHHKRNGQMFGSLVKYQDEEFFNNHPYFDIYTLDGCKNTYQIFAITVVNSTSDSYKKVYVNEEEYLNYINMVKEISLHKADVKITADSNIVSLSTCTNVRVEERLVIHGVKISQEQTK